MGRRWNIDAVYKHSPYEAFAGNPIGYLDPLGLDTINFNKQVTTFYPGGGQKPVGKSSFSINVHKHSGADVYLYNVTNTTINSKGKSETVVTRTILHPENRESAAGMTKGLDLYFDGLITAERNNYDWESIGKLMYADKSFEKYMNDRNANATDWMEKAGSFQLMEGLMPMAVQMGVGAYLGFTVTAINTQKATSLEAIFSNPNVLRRMTEQEVRTIAESTPGWKVGALGKGKNIGKGLTVREFNPAGTDYTHRYIQYHPGTERHFGGNPYWKISGTTNGAGVTRIEL